MENKCRAGYGNCSDGCSLIKHLEFQSSYGGVALYGNRESGAGPHWLRLTWEDFGKRILNASTEGCLSQEPLNTRYEQITVEKMSKGELH